LAPDYTFFGAGFRGPFIILPPQNRGDLMVWRKLSLLFYPLVIVIVLLADLGDPAQWNNGRLGPVRIDLLVHLFLFLPWALLARHMWAPAFSSGPFSSYVILMLIGKTWGSTSAGWLLAHFSVSARPLFESCFSFTP
jgi:hypothetical protein